MYFSYEPNGDGLTLHKTAKQARDAAEGALDAERDEAQEGWAENVSEICWGRIEGRATLISEHKKRPDEAHECEVTAVYEMRPKRAGQKRKRRE